MEKESEDTKVEMAEEGEATGNGNDARLKILQQINDQNDASLAENGDLADVNDDGTTSAFTKEETLSDEEVAARELQRAEDEANLAPKDEPHEEAKHKIKVNGKELELTTDELVERAQKVESADTYLKEASQKLRDAEANAAKPTLPSIEDVTAKAAEERRALVRAIQMGTEDEAMAAIEKLQSRTPSVSADDVARTVDERLTFNDAVSRFQTEYKDLAEDQVLLNIVLQRDKELIAQGDKRSYWERYEDIGNSVRDWKDKLTKPATTETQKPVSDKQTRKASASAVPQGAGTKAPAAVNDEDKEESVVDVISAMAKARGGPQWLRS